MYGVRAVHAGAAVGLQLRAAGAGEPESNWTLIGGRWSRDRNAHLRLVQVNQITAWLDGSNVYGSDEDEATKLRLLGGEESRCSSFLRVSVLTALRRRAAARDARAGPRPAAPQPRRVRGRGAPPLLLLRRGPPLQ